MSVPSGPAIGLIELCSIARGLRVVDVLVKKSPVRVRRATTIHPGKYLIVVQGGVDEVKEAMAAGCSDAGETLIDQLILPFPHTQLDALLDAGSAAARPAALGVLEAYSVAGIVRAADAALKAAEVDGLRLALADGLGGKGYFVFTGAQHDVEEGLAAGRRAIGDGLVAGQELIANPHADMVAALLT
jgi:microcompartment protein CcmL/EutN